MKKLINKPEDVVTESLEGFLAMYGELYEKIPGANGILYKNRGNDRVAFLVGGGSGHEPLFTLFVGENLADASVAGNIFASPDPFSICEAAHAVDMGRGIVFFYGNYAGDIMNFDMAVEMLEAEGIKCRTIRMNDDVASAPHERINDRRGIAGDILAVKIGGAVTSAGLSLDECERVITKAKNSIRSIGIALSPGTLPGASAPPFVLGPNEVEFGMGIHGEPGIRRAPLQSADETVEILLDEILKDMPLTSEDEVCTLINGLGSTTLMELLILNRKLKMLLDNKGIRIHAMEAGSYCTTQEMAGMSISIMKLDEELKRYYDLPAYSPYYSKR